MHKYTVMHHCFTSNLLNVALLHIFSITENDIDFSVGLNALILNLNKNSSIVALDI